MVAASHLFRLLPALCSFVAFILAVLALFASNKQGFLEDYNIIMVSAPLSSQEEISSRLNLDCLGQHFWSRRQPRRGHGRDPDTHSNGRWRLQ